MLTIIFMTVTINWKLLQRFVVLTVVLSLYTFTSNFKKCLWSRWFLSVTIFLLSVETLRRSIPLPAQSSCSSGDHDLVLLLHPHSSLLMRKTFEIAGLRRKDQRTNCRLARHPNHVLDHIGYAFWDQIRLHKLHQHLWNAFPVPSARIQSPQHVDLWNKKAHWIINRTELDY